MLTLPTILYRAPGKHVGPPVKGKSSTYDCIGAKTADQVRELLADGWCVTLPEAVGAKPVQPPPRIDDPDVKRSMFEIVGDAAYDAAVASGASEEEASAAAKAAAEAVAPKKAAPLANVSEESTAERKVEIREALEAEAKSLGVSFDGRTTDKSLGEKIAEAKKKKA